MDIVKTKKLGTAACCLVLLIMLLCAVEFLPEIEGLKKAAPLYIPVFIAAIPFCMTFAVVYCGYRLGAVSVIAGFSAAYLAGASVCVYIAAAFIFPAAAASVLIKQKLRLRTSVLLSALTALAGISLVYALLFVSTGMKAVDYAAASTGNYLGSLNENEIKFVYQLARYPELLTGAVTQQALDAASAQDAVLKLKSMLAGELNISIVYYTLVYALTLGYLVYIIPRSVYKRTGGKTNRIRKVSDYELPRRFWLACILLCAAAFAGNSYGLSGFDVLLITLINLSVFIFMAQGFCVLLYFFEQSSMKKGMKVVLIVSAVLFLRTVAMPIIGLCENMFGLRRRIREARKQG